MPSLPPPSSIHPAYIIDAHSYVPADTNDQLALRSPDPIFGGLAKGAPRPEVKSVVQVKLDVSADPAGSVLGVKPFSIHPTILNVTLAQPPSITNIAKGAVDIIVPAVRPMSDKDWDLLDEAVTALEGSWESIADAGGPGSGPESEGRVVISGLLPPPLNGPSDTYIHDLDYDRHLTRLNMLALRSNIYLKALPPVVATDLDGKQWWENRKEVERMLKLHLTPAIEAFGTHRIIFGSSTALPLPEPEPTSSSHHSARRNSSSLIHAAERNSDSGSPTTRPVRQMVGSAEWETSSLVSVVDSGEWYGVLRKCLTELGEVEEAVTGVFGENAKQVYRL